MVEVENQDRKRHPIARAAPKDEFAALHERVTARSASQGIDPGKQALMKFGAFLHQRHDEERHADGEDEILEMDDPEPGIERRQAISLHLPRQDDADRNEQDSRMHAAEHDGGPARGERLLEAPELDRRSDDVERTDEGARRAAKTVDGAEGAYEEEQQEERARKQPDRHPCRPLNSRAACSPTAPAAVKMVVAMAKATGTPPTPNRLMMPMSTQARAPAKAHHSSAGT